MDTKNYRNWKSLTAYLFFSLALILVVYEVLQESKYDPALLHYPEGFTGWGKSLNGMIFIFTVLSCLVLLSAVFRKIRYRWSLIWALIIVLVLWGARVIRFFW